MTRLPRRGFLALAGGSLTAIFGAASARSAMAPARRTVLIQRSPVAGLQYHGLSLWPRLAAGDALTLVREPDNPHDRYAVRVDWQGWKLGYVPRVQNTAVAQMLDRGELLHARIAELIVEGDEDDNLGSPWRRVKMKIYLV